LTYEKAKIILAICFALSVLGAYSTWSYFREEKRLIAQIDAALFSAAAAVPFVLADDFHDRAVGPGSIPETEDRRNIENLSHLNNRLGTKFLYTVIRDQNATYRLSSSSALDTELEQGEEVHYYTAYPDASDMLIASFKRPQSRFGARSDVYYPVYVPIFSDRWGTYRSVFIPMRSPGGRLYAVGADMDITYVKALLRKNTVETVMEFLIFTLATLPIVYAYISAIRRKNHEYRQVHRLYLNSSKLSETDPLTQVCNRLKLDEVLRKTLEYYHEDGRPFALVMIDIDHFKAINDRYGHRIGDDVLQRVTQICVGNSRASDIVGRWGGDEFLIVCPDSDIAGAYRLAENLRILISKALEEPYGISASIGVAQPAPGMTLPELLERVDQAMYKAKRAGRNRTSKAES